MPNFTDMLTTKQVDYLVRHGFRALVVGSKSRKAIEEAGLLYYAFQVCRMENKDQDNETYELSEHNADWVPPSDLTEIKGKTIMSDTIENEVKPSGPTDEQTENFNGLKDLLSEAVKLAVETNDPTKFEEIRSQVGDKCFESFNNKDEEVKIVHSNDFQKLKSFWQACYRHLETITRKVAADEEVASLFK